MARTVHPAPPRTRPHPGLCLFLLAAVACAGPGVEAEGDPSLSVHLRISPTPPMTGVALVSVEVSDAGTPAPGGSRVLATPLAPSGARGETRELAHGAPGAWGGEVAFTERGESRLEISVTLPGGRAATFRYPVTVARRPVR